MQHVQHVVAEEEKEYGDQDGNEQVASQERISQQEEEQPAEAEDKADSEAEDEAPLEPKAGSQRELADGEGSAVTEPADGQDGGEGS